MKIKFLILVPVFLIISVCLLLPGFYNSYNLKLYNKINGTPLQFSHLLVRDTIFILSDYYIKLSLKNQNVEIIFRNDSSLSFKISSGTSRLEKGKDTPTGIYTVQSKSPVAISKQFENAELLNWIGFNGNIGFHGLKGNSYYWRLGKTPSSHGCIRISREDGERLYKMAKRGTPIIVVDGEPARIYSFAYPKDFDPNKDIMLYEKGKNQAKLLNRRLDNLYKGKANYVNFGKIFLDGNTILKPGGYSIGEAERIALYQEPLISKQLEYFKLDNSTTSKLMVNNKKDSLFKSIYTSSHTLQHTSQ